MKRLFKIFVIAAVLAAGWIALDPQRADSQVTVTTTTLSAAVASGDNFMTVASNTGFSAGRIAYIDREAMRIVSVDGTVIRVTRGQEGTAGAVGHSNGSVIFVGPPEYFIRTDPTGTCTAANTISTPRVNVTNGNLWACREGYWTAVNFEPLTNHVTWESIDTNANYTALLTDTWINFTDRQSQVLVTLPSITGIRGKILIITLGDNVTTAGIIAYGVNGQTFASTGLSGTAATVGAGAALRLLSTGTGWVTW